jgi:hypothetical protein
MIEKLTKPWSIRSTGNFWATDCSTGESSEDAIDCVVVEDVVLCLRAVPVWDVRLIPDLGVIVSIKCKDFII